MKNFLFSTCVVIVLAGCEAKEDYSQCSVITVKSTSLGTKCFVSCNRNGTYGWMGCPDTTKVGARVTFQNP